MGARGELQVIFAFSISPLSSLSHLSFCYIGTVKLLTSFCEPGALLVKIHCPSWLWRGFAVFANGVCRNQSRECEYCLREPRGEMRNLRKKLLSFENPHSNTFLPLFEYFLSAFWAVWFLKKKIKLLPHSSPALIYSHLVSFSRKTSFLWWSTSMEETSCSTSRAAINSTFPEQRKILILAFGPAGCTRERSKLGTQFYSQLCCCPAEEILGRLFDLSSPCPAARWGWCLCWKLSPSLSQLSPNSTKPCRPFSQLSEGLGGSNFPSSFPSHRRLLDSIHIITQTWPCFFTALCSQAAQPA